MLVKRLFKSDGYGFNEAHVDALTATDTKKMKDYKRVSIAKKAYMVSNLTPLHFVCLNPNIKVIEHFFNLCPEFSIVDYK